MADAPALGAGAAKAAWRFDPSLAYEVHVAGLRDTFVAARPSPGRLRGSPVYWPDDASDDDRRAEFDSPTRGRAPSGTAEPGDRRHRPAPVSEHPRPRFPTGQGPATH